MDRLSCIQKGAGAQAERQAHGLTNDREQNGPAGAALLLATVKWVEASLSDKKVNIYWHTTLSRYLFRGFCGLQAGYTR
jgi:hypothetical protein